MTDELAERLLVKVLAWGPEEVRLNLAVVQALATWKYDSYERFGHGRRFVESLALWLEQFKSIEERRVAFDFIAYHERSKHHPERYASGPHGLDWATQPNPFR